MKRTPALKSLLKQLGDIPSNIHSFRYDPKTGEFEATFRSPALPVVEAFAKAPTEAADTVPRFIPGTLFLDDESPLNPIDLIMNTPKALM